MNVGELLQRFFDEGEVGLILALIGVDFVLGSLSALKRGQFRLSYVVDFLRNDVLFKVVPYFVVYAGALVTDGEDVIAGIIDLGDIAAGLLVGILAALAASILNSLAELKDAPRQPQSLKLALAGDENAAPPKD